MIGRTVAHYQILEQIGGGGMGVVYKARDTRLQRIVALKFLPPSLSTDPDAKSRFIQEAHAASSLQDDNICTIHDINETDEGQLFIVMEHYEGETLKTRIERGRLEITEALHIAIQVTQGLLTAHEKGTIHRDIKPANLFITRTGSAKILDFGLAKLLGQVGLTQAGTTAGTVAYMSPEQLQGSEVDHRSDLWSLGVILYEMVCQRRPFTAEHEAALGYQIMNVDPVAAGEVAPSTPPGVSRVILKLLAKDPSSRYQHAGELLADLQREQKEIEGSGIRPAAAVPDQKRNGFRLKPPVVALLVAGLIVIVGGIYFLQRNGEESSAVVAPAEERSGDVDAPPRIAVLYLESLGSSEEGEFFAAGMTEDIITEISNIRGVLVLSRHDVMPYREKQLGIKTIGQELGVDYVLEGSVRRQADQLRVTVQMIRVEDGFHAWAERYDREMKDVFKVQSEIARSVASALEIALTEEEQRTLEIEPTENLEAYDLFLRGRELREKRSFEDNKEAEKLLRRAIDLDKNYGLAYAGLASVYLQRFDWGFSTDTKWLEEGKILIDKAYSLDSTSVFVHREYGIYYRLAPDEEKCVYWLRRAINLKPNDYMPHYGLGVAYSAFGRHEEAVKELNEALRLRPDHPESYRFLARSAFASGNREESDRYIKKGLELSENSAHMLDDAARLAARAGKFEVAESYLRRAIEKKPGTHRHTGMLGMVQLFNGEVDTAIENLRAGVTGTGSLYYQYYLGWAYRLAGRELEAGEAFRNSLRRATDLDTYKRQAYFVLMVRQTVDPAHQFGDELMDLAKKEIVGMDSTDRSYYLAAINTLAGNEKEGVDHLIDFLDSSVFAPRYVLSDPVFLSLKENPRLSPYSWE
jgi:non-specific serine/threonine protein kinase